MFRSHRKQPLQHLDESTMGWVPQEQEVKAVLKMNGARRCEYFVKRVVDTEQLWSLRGGDGWVLMADDTGTPLVPVWPHERYAQECADGDWADCQPSPIALQAWLRAWRRMVARSPCSRLRSARALSWLPENWKQLCGKRWKTTSSDRRRDRSAEAHRGELAGIFPVFVPAFQCPERKAGPREIGIAIEPHALSGAAIALEHEHVRAVGDAPQSDNRSGDNGLTGSGYGHGKRIRAEKGGSARRGPADLAGKQSIATREHAGSVRKSRLATHARISQTPAKAKRRERDSNPWYQDYPVHRFSKPALSATQPSLRGRVDPGVLQFVCGSRRHSMTA